MPATAIPEWARLIVKDRAGVRCERCGTPNPTGEWHHRRSRSTRGQHQHCPCNGVWLCMTCHQWVHAHPLMARLSGWIVSRHAERPQEFPVHTYIGLRFHDCVGNYEWSDQDA